MVTTLSAAVLSTRASGPRITIATVALAPGIYTVVLSGAQGRASGRLMIMHPIE
ncbi:MAG: hypothetical protein ABI599_16190 [Flavobacteriales bacterium]